MSKHLTVFQTIDANIRDWERGGKRGPAPARLVFRSDQYGVSAVVDPYRKLPGTVVVFPHEGESGSTAHLCELPVSRYLSVGIVSQQVSLNILNAHSQGLRAIEHVEGYAVPDHAHTVLFPARRGEGKALYEPGSLPSQDKLDRELNETLEKIRFTEAQSNLVTSHLEIIQSIAPLLDQDQIPAGVALGLTALTNRVLYTN